MYFPLAELSGEQRSKLLHSTVVPRPIAWITSRSATGAVNAAPFSFFNVMSAAPPLLSVCIGSRQGIPRRSACRALPTARPPSNAAAARSSTSTAAAAW